MVEHLTEYSLYYLIGLTCLLVILLLVIAIRGRKANKKVVPAVETKKSDLELEAVLKSMEESTPTKKALSFEQEQEENAIISYKELLEAAKGKIEETETVPTVAVEPSLEVVEEVEEIPVIEEVETLPNIEEFESTVVETDEPKRFKNSEFISPVFGKDEPKESSDTNDEFLAALKSFRSSL